VFQKSEHLVAARLKSLFIKDFIECALDGYVLWQMFFSKACASPARNPPRRIASAASTPNF